MVVGRTASRVVGLVWAHQDLTGMRTSTDTCAFIQPRVVTAEKTQNSSKLLTDWDPRNKGAEIQNRDVGWGHKSRAPLPAPSHFHLLCDFR